jgi:hypothetical protein
MADAQIVRQPIPQVLQPSLLLRGFGCELHIDAVFGPAYAADLHPVWRGALKVKLPELVCQELEDLVLRHVRWQVLGPVALAADLVAGADEDSRVPVRWLHQGISGEEMCKATVSQLLAEAEQGSIEKTRRRQRADDAVADVRLGVAVWVILEWNRAWKRILHSGEANPGPLFRHRRGPNRGEGDEKEEPRLDFNFSGQMSPRDALCPVSCYGFGHVTTGLGTWRTHGYLLYLVALLPLSLFFRFVALV